MLPESQPDAPPSPEQSGQRRLTGAYLIALDRIEPDPDQPRKRIDPTKLSELAESIRNLGILQPISVRLVPESQKYRIIAGECRYQASLQVGLAEMPCWIRTPDQRTILLQQVVENWTRTDLSPFELADSLAVLRDAHGFHQQELAAHTGKSKGEISKLLAILELPPEVQKLARDDVSGRIGRRHLYALRSFPVERQLRIVRSVQQGHYTAESLEQLAEVRAHASDTGNASRPNWQQRSFTTEYAKVVFTFRKPVVTAADVLKAMAEIERQLRKGDAA